MALCGWFGRGEAAATPARPPLAARASADGSPLDTARPAPRVRRGERYDGRAGRGPSASEVLLALPRAVLFVPRVVLGAVLRAVEALVGWMERSGVSRALGHVVMPLGGRVRLHPELRVRPGRVPLGGLALETDLLAGLRGRAYLAAWGLAGTRDTWRVGARLLLLGRDAVPWRVGVEARYRVDESLPFSGRGYRRPAPAARVAQRALWAGLDVRWTPRHWLGLRWRGGFEQRRLEDGRARGGALPASQRFDPDRDLPGFGRRLGYLSTAVRARVGRPLALGPPPAGVHASVELGAHFGLESAAHRHLRVGLVGEAFAAPFDADQRLGARFQLAWARRLADAAVPLLFLPRVAGWQAMRGFASGRFWGEGLVVLSFEYHRALDAAGRWWWSLFVDGGGAFRESFRGDANALDISGGGAIRWRLWGSTWLTVQVTGSRDGPRAELAIGGALSPRGPVPRREE